MGRTAINNGSEWNKTGPTGKIMAWSHTKDCILKHTDKTSQPCCGNKLPQASQLDNASCYVSGCYFLGFIILKAGGRRGRRQVGIVLSFPSTWVITKNEFSRAMWSEGPLATTEIPGWVFRAATRWWGATASQPSGNKFFASLLFFLKVPQISGSVTLPRNLLLNSLVDIIMFLAVL